MEEKYNSLFTPWKIGNVEIKNRIVLCPMGGTSIFGWMEPNHFDKEAAKFLMDKAKNNVGLVIPGIAPIRNMLGGKWLYKSKGMYKKLEKFMTEFHKTGSKMFIQLTAGFGRSMAVNEIMEKLVTNPVLKVLSKPILDVERLCASASATPNRWSEKVTSRPLSVKEIEEMVDGFARIAKLCQESGVDGIEVHAVHEGYLLDQFTLKYTNFRTDEYGGCFENRYRFPVEIVKAIKRACGNDFPVSLRYSVISKTKGFNSGALPNEKYVEVGRDYEESIAAAKYLEAAGYDMLNCDNGTYDAWYWAHPPVYMPKDCNLKDVEFIKEHVSIPVVCAGRMEPNVAAKAINEGKIDAMGVARQFLCDTEWVTKLIEGREEEIRPCICCHNACFNMAHYKGVGNDQDLSDTMHMSRCALNPTTMNTKKYKIVPTKHPLHIAIIGGGIGGMETAIVSTLRGHKVTIYEKSNELGGVFIAASTPVFKEKDRELIEFYKHELARLEIEVKFGVEVKDLKDIAADEYVIATGAKAKTIKCLDNAKVVEAVDYLLDNSKVGKKVLVVGGGLTGAEIAYDLYLKGKTPIIVEQKQDIIAQKGVCLANSSYLREYFALHNVEIHLESSIKEVTSTGAIITSIDGKDINLEVDNVISSIGYFSAPLVSNAKHIHIVGDAHVVGNLRDVISRAWDVAMKL
ncbi:MAG: FAD-dependent oxidoreductase [Bacilli bacterium]